MTDSQIKEVCKICFNASSQKSIPTLTLEHKAIYDPISKKKQCPTCKQIWTGQNVARDFETNRWVIIRQRPLKINPVIDYQLCASVLKKQGCTKGQGLCTFAHSKVELIAWNRERYQDPRPVPSIAQPNQLTLCKHVLKEGNCPYGQRCTFAHSEEELDQWLSSLGGRGFTPVIHAGPQPEFYCTLCDIRCTSRRQYDDHLSGQRHRQIASLQPPPLPIHHHPNYNMPVPQYPPMNFMMDSGIVRPLPNRLPVSGFRMCVSIMNGRRCLYEDKCTFAHSRHELDVWNDKALHLRMQRFAAGPIHQNIKTTHSDLDEFEGEQPEVVTENADFAQTLRTTVMLDYQDSNDPNKELCGLEKTLQNVTITEITGKDEALTVQDNGGNVMWIFEVSATTPRTLQSVVLFDMLAPEYSIDGVELVMYGGHTRTITPLERAESGFGVSLNQAIKPPDKINVKIVFKPRSGVLGQSVLFNFGTFYMMRCLCVHVVNEQDRRTLLHVPISQKKIGSRPVKIDYFWEQHYSSDEMDGLENIEDGDDKLSEFSLPEQVEELIEKGKYKNVERIVKQKSYVRRIHNLLYLEEFQQRKDLSRYDLYDVEIKPTSMYQTHGELIKDPRYSFVTLDMDELLFEGGRSIRPSDFGILLLHVNPVHRHELHKCIVHNVMKESVVLKMSKKTEEACNASLNRGSVRFQPSRIDMRAMHQAVETTDIEILFPKTEQDSDTSYTSLDSLPHSLKRCMRELEGSVLNKDQQKAIHSVLDPAFKKIPTLVLGPFGCGKTRTLSECVNFLSLYEPEAKILVCTHNNSAADIYVKAIHKEWIAKSNSKAPMLRLYYTGRRLNTVDADVLPYCKIEDQRFSTVKSSELEDYTIVVTTTITARMLWLNGVKKGYFTHILVDEAAQVLESELLIPLCLADTNTKIVLAGDTMQMDPPVYSTIAKKYGLDTSLLERLYYDESYTRGKGLVCKIQLTDNHRSHADILYLPSKLFYKNKLVCKAVFNDNGPKDIPHLQFVGVDGHEAQDENSPSIYNDQETYQIGEEVERLHQGGLQPDEICVLSYYQLQVLRLRSHLRSKRLSQVKVDRIERIQGKEYRALIISTVRTCASDFKQSKQEDIEDEIQSENGFLNNVKFFNTAITRSKEWLVIVGEPITLCTVGYNSPCWMELIKHCIELKTFKYQCPELFMKFLETRVISRQMMQKQHGEFLKKSTAPPQANKIIAPPTSSTVSDSDIRQVTQHMSSLSFQQQQQQLVKDKVIKLMQTPDDVLASKIYGEILKLPTAHLSTFLTQPESAAKYVRELENASKRGGPTSVLMNNARLQPPTQEGMQSSANPVTQNLANVMGDLPSFLKNQVESLTSHLRFCESQKSSVQLSTASLQNLAEQRNLLMKQMSLVNEQILKYREFARLNQKSVLPTQPKSILDEIPFQQQQLLQQQQQQQHIQQQQLQQQQLQQQQIQQHQMQQQQIQQPAFHQTMNHIPNELKTKNSLTSQFQAYSTPSNTNLHQSSTQFQSHYTNPNLRLGMPHTNTTGISGYGMPNLSYTGGQFPSSSLSMPGNYGGGFPSANSQFQQPLNLSAVPGGGMNHLPGMNLGLLGSNVGMRQQFIPSQQPTYSQMMGQSNMGIRMNIPDQTSNLLNSQPSLGQTTHLISPLSNLGGPQPTWNGDDDID